MNARTGFVVTLALTLMGAGAAFAQSDPAAPSMPAERSVNGVAYVNGGVGEGQRAAMSQIQSGYPLKLVFSGPGGQYLIADHVTVKGRDGEVLDLDKAGPWLLVKLPPGDYTVSASYEGKVVQRPVRVGTAATTLNWRFGAG